jgi:hypothetical protein
MLNFGERNILAGDVPIKNRLVPHIPTFNDYIVHRCWKAWVTNERKDEIVDIFITMSRGHRYDFKRLERFQNRRDRRFRGCILSVSGRMGR